MLDFPFEFGLEVRKEHGEHTRHRGHDSGSTRRGGALNA